MDNFLLFTPMLAEAAVGDVDPRHIVTPIRQLAPEAELIQGEVTAIDAGRKSVTVQPVFGAGPVTVQGDVLVIALGSIPHTYGVKGVEEHAIRFKEISDALRIRNRVLALLEGASHDHNPWLTKLAVVGAGYSGAELAAALGDFVGDAARRFYRDAPVPEVTLVDAVERVTPALSEALSASAARALNARGVKLALGSAVAEVTDRGVRLANGDLIEAATVIWAAGIRPHPLVSSFGLPTERGKLVVDGQMRVAPGIYAVGDAALVPSGGGGASPPTAQFALRQGRYLGRHLLEIEAGNKTVPEFSYGTKGELVSLGHRNAVGKVLGVPVSGLIGWFLWRSYYLLQLPTFLRKARVALDWTLDMLFPPDVAWIPSSDLGPKTEGTNPET
jgi:NADH dehydrogenase